MTPTGPCQDQPATLSRRRGAELEDALLQAAWDELAAVGYPGLTMEGVACRAGTSRAVLYRRWASRPELVMAAVRRHGRAGPPAPPDTGNVRDDMLAQVRYMADKISEVAGLASLMLTDFFDGAGTSPRELRDRALAPELAALDAMLDAAEQRGELKPGVRHSRIATVAIDLVRNELVTWGANPSDEVLIDIVDNVWVPLACTAERRS